MTTLEAANLVRYCAAKYCEEHECIDTCKLGYRNSCVWKNFRKLENPKKEDIYTLYVLLLCVSDFTDEIKQLQSFFGGEWYGKRI